MSSCNDQRPMQQPSCSRTVWLDGFALCASSLCTLHCLGLPLLFALLPAFAGRIDPGESFHLIMFGLAVPTSLFALIQGWRRRGSVGLPIMGVSGLALMAIGALVANGIVAEATWTVLGSAVLAGSHVLNWRHMRARLPG